MLENINNIQFYLITFNTIILIITFILLHLRLKTLNKYINNIFTSVELYKQQKKIKYLLYFISVIFYLMFNYFIIYMY